MAEKNAAPSLRKSRCAEHSERSSASSRVTARPASSGVVLRSSALMRQHASGRRSAAAAREHVERCQPRGLWPVLVGSAGRRDALLAAPIILYDYPQLAPESPGDFFDGTEIDELLTLRVLTLTDEEKAAMAGSDPRARALLERTEALGLERLGGLHGRLEPRARLRVGAAVIIRPKRRGDIFDLALEGKRATVQALERDLEGRTHVAVTVDDDPGRDLGAYGHRFFFSPDEVELL